MPPIDDTTEQNEQPNPEEKLNATINSAVTAQLKRAMSKQAEEFKTLLADSLKAFKPAPPPEDEDTKKQQKQADPALAAMRAQVEAMQASLAEANTKRERAEAKQREDKAFGELKDALKNKARPDMVDLLAKNFFYADKRVEFDDEGNPLFRVKRSTPGLADEDVLMPLQEGVNQFLGSKEAAPFLPAPVPGGTTQQRGSRMPVQTTHGSLGPNGMPKYDKPATTDAEKIRRALEKESILMNRQK